ncbi:MAG: glutaredoxin family protein [Gammaproteobacteria bacterium]|nr:glutaredoxin family protein [Gammaproteobacteria bacterium]MDH5591352.1 glutaredoxin family protein [Gammaproteobacteria bacterium]
MITVILYTTAGCHLCELAEAMLQDMSSQHDIKIVATEIGDNDELVARYGIKIPVIRFLDGSELNWPFEAHEILTKISQLVAN